MRMSLSCSFLRPTSLRRAVWCVAALAAASVPAVGQAPAALDTSVAFVLLRGTDTVSVEHVVRTPSRLTGDLNMHTGRRAYSASLTPAGLIRSLELSAYAPGAPATAAPVAHAVVAFFGDSVSAVLGRGKVQRMATQRDALPWLNPSFGIVEQIVRRARIVGGAAATIPLFSVQGGITSPATVVRVGSDSVVVSFVDVQLRLHVAPDGTVLGGIIPSQNVVVERVQGAAAAALRVAAPDYSAPAGAPYRAINVTVPTPGGFTLGGTLTLPIAAPGPVPGVVTITGSGEQNRDEALPGISGYRPFREFADTLGRRGIAVLRLDDRGYGASGGNAATATSADFANDVRAALAYLRTRPEVDPRRLFLLGHSEGAMIAPMVAATDTTLRGIVLLAAPARTGRDILLGQIRYAVEHNAALSPARRDSLLATVPAQEQRLAAATPWMRYFAAYDPSVVARRVRTPVLILQGGNDQQITPNQAGELAADFRAAGNRDVTVREFPGLDHLFLPDPTGNPAGYATLPSRHLPADVRGAVTDWIVAHARL